MTQYEILRDTINLLMSGDKTTIERILGVNYKIASDYQEGDEKKYKEVSVGEIQPGLQSLSKNIDTKDLKTASRMNPALAETIALPVSKYIMALEDENASLREEVEKLKKDIKEIKAKLGII